PCRFRTSVSCFRTAAPSLWAAASRSFSIAARAVGSSLPPIDSCSESNEAWTRSAWESGFSGGATLSGYQSGVAGEGAPGYVVTMVTKRNAVSGGRHKETGRIVVERVQTGVRMEKRLVKVLKALAELKDLTLGDLLEGIVLHAFEGKPSPFTEQTLRQIADLK